ncbi:universal stress protein [Teichococcus aestuarii]|uniref:Universal stress protein UspA n=1 Tax=Teichococcus aestuarii TaxID=568898 RepID=A0A2U1V391_9PROT|nr:universal stress protein [Pseudoroseomonas aestuarii]PWC28388.1 universal stress protein UspA [Pseudoroseomonas aestuarii]
MARILACTDGSIYAPSIYGHAAWAASRLNAAVEVLHMLDRHPGAAREAELSGAIGFDASQDLLRKMVELDEAQGRLAQQRSRAILEDAEWVLRAAGIAEVTLTLRHGALVEALPEFEKAADLVVVGKRGEAADFAKGHLGSNLERVLRTSICPVLVASRAFKPISRAVIAYDGRAASRKAVEYLARRPLLHGVSVHLLTVGNAGTDEEGLAEARFRLGEAGLDVHMQILPGRPEDVIARVVAESGADLLVMGAYGHGVLTRMFLGSVTSTLLRECRVPALVFR